MKKTVHIINAMQIGGVEAGVLNLLKSKIKEDYSVITVKSCDNDLYQLLSADEQSRLYICNGYLKALLLLMKLKPQVVVSSLWRGHLVSLFYRLISPQIKRVHFVHNAGYGHFINNKITMVSIANADIILTDSLESNKWFTTEMCRNDGIVVPMNVSFSNSPKSIDFDPLSFVFVGRFCKQKNLTQSIDFIKKLNDLGLKVSYDLYGRDDGELDELSAYAITLGLSKLITFHGSVPPTEIESEMKKYNYYLQSSTAEGMAISVYQAIKNGLLAVINPVGEMQNYSKDGVNAFYLNLNDIEHSANRFKDLVDSKAIEKFNVGYILNKENYPNFDSSFFSEINKI